MSFSNFSLVHMFCNEDRSKLVPGSTRPGDFTSWMIVDNLHEKLKSEDLLFKNER